MHHVKEFIIAVIYSNHLIEFWDAREVKNIYLLKRFHSHSDSILYVSRLSNTSAVTYSRDGTIGMWNVQNTLEGSLIEMEKSIFVEQISSQSAFAVSSLHGIIVIGDSLGLLTIYKLDGLIKEVSIQAHESAITYIIISGMLACLNERRLSSFGDFR